MPPGSSLNVVDRARPCKPEASAIGRHAPGVALLALLAPAFAAPAIAGGGDLAYGEYLSGTCVTCHGGAGAAGAIPRIDDLPYAEFVRALAEYRDGVRTNAAMVSVARGLGEEEIAALAAFYANDH